MASFAIPGQTEEFATRVTAHCRIAKDLQCPQINIKSGNGRQPRHRCEFSQIV
ncbi:hypothetical protein ACPOL_2935 [Acidisarcina polymorpha]|uniref:Uncharacterized protein n=1 Tax=Acidisarcina polymorpha TaxID=2211140 RepID=A0A2Z5G0K2_9BACT|nr:hypothetical protein ACPOL_2935 [Acidisarcina polymorpha]